MDKQRGKYICIDGVDASGKSTLIRNVVNHHGDAGKRTPAVISFPSTGAVGSLIREYLYGDREIKSFQALLYLFAADGEEQKRWMHEQLARGSTLIADRHPLLPALAYQLDYHPENTIWTVIDLARSMVPDLLLILDVSADVSLNRLENRKGRSHEIFNRPGRDRLIKIRGRYQTIAHCARSRGLAKKCVVINGAIDEDKLLAAALEAAELQ